MWETELREAPETEGPTGLPMALVERSSINQGGKMGPTPEILLQPPHLCMLWHMYVCPPHTHTQIIQVKENMNIFFQHISLLVLKFENHIG